MPSSPHFGSSLSTTIKSKTNHNLQRIQAPNFSISIAPVTAPTLPAYRRLITLLLPIRYPDNFYKDSIANPTSSSLALCALSPETPRPGKPKSQSLDHEQPPSVSAIDASEAKVIGGIQCRLEPLPCPPHDTFPTASTAPSSSHQQPHNLYIQTLAVLSPYRSLGVATALLDATVSTALIHYPRENIKVEEIYAHVWEANEEALEWYMKRGFEVGGEVVVGYYRKLRPSGARVVRRRVGVRDWVGAVGGWKEDSEESHEKTEERAKDLETDKEEGVGRKDDGGNG